MLSASMPRARFWSRVFPLLAVGCASTTTGAGVPQDDPPASEASRSVLCARAKSKCGGAGVSNCDAAIASTNARYVEAFSRCLDNVTPCDFLGCQAVATKEIAPGFPNLPPINGCTDKNAACKAKVDYLCKRIPRLDGAGVARANECVAKSECAVFESCLRGVTEGSGL